MARPARVSKRDAAAIWRELCAAAPRGARVLIMRKWAARLGCSVATVYRVVQPSRSGPAAVEARRAARIAARAETQADHARRWADHAQRHADEAAREAARLARKCAAIVA